MAENQNVQQELIALAEKLPAQYKDNALELVGRMFTVIEGLDDNDSGGTWTIPSLKLVQAMTDRSSIPKNAHIGSLVLGEEVLGQPLEIIPIRAWLSRSLWDPDLSNNKSICWSPDAEMGMNGQACKGCPSAKWNEEEKKVDCTLTRSFLVVSTDLKHMFKVNFSKTNYTFGTELLEYMKKASVSTFKRFYKLQTESGKRSKNVEALVPTPGGTVPAELHEFLAHLFQVFSDDRRGMLEGFHAAALERRNNAPQLAGPTAGEDGTILIESKTTVVDANEASSGYKL